MKRCKIVAGTPVVDFEVCWPESGGHQSTATETGRMRLAMKIKTSRPKLRCSSIRSTFRHLSLGRVEVRR